MADPLIQRREVIEGYLRAQDAEIATLTAGLTFERDAHREMSAVAAERTAALLRAEAENEMLRTAGNDVAAALNAAMDGGEVLDAEAIDHCNYVIDHWVSVQPDQARAILEGEKGITS